MDFAWSDGYMVIVTLNDDGRLVHFDRVRREGWPEIQRRVEATAEQYDGPIHPDVTRDNKIVGDLEAAGVRVEPVTFSRMTKRDLIEDLITTVEAGEIVLPDMDPLVPELEVSERETTDAGNVRYHASPGFHDDCVDALAVDALANASSGAASTTVRLGGGDANGTEGSSGGINLNEIAR